jgi:hypothetical protein
MSGSGAASCPLCRGESVIPFARAHGREYLDCATCGLIHVAPADRPDPATERAHYDTHENDPSDAGYRSFLRRVVDPLLARLSPGDRGLDYGSGPGPTLSVMLAEQGHPTAIYDPFFAPDPAVLAERYDFITCTETAEHFFHPGDELTRLDGLLRPGGWLAIMTELYLDGRLLEEWRYARDPTHVSLYRRRTMDWIARRFGWGLEMPSRTVALFRKGAPSRRP